ncbi:Rne/Rng family ribonuclease [Longispora albida]|uniref:Rne/Rng family ribonuclease n=1 Tax=Longispora albida TaxID=203523 RepID=UPI000363B38B|nr:Rne/Rng family ribonuclease [Longispora albida]
MLDNEPTGGTEAGTEPATGTAPDTETTAPVRKRAPRKRAAATAPPAEAAESPAAAEGSAASEGETDEAPKARRTRKKAADAPKATRTRKKKAEVAETAEAEETAEISEEAAEPEAVEATEADAADEATEEAAEELEAEAEEEHAPVEKPSRRRKGGLAATVVFMPPEPVKPVAVMGAVTSPFTVPSAQTPASPFGAPSLMPALVTPFTPPETPEPEAAEQQEEISSVRRRRSRRDRAEEVVAEEVTEAEDAEEADDEDDDAPEGRRSRRRRGRRGRGRGKGGAEDSDDETAEADSDSDEEEPEDAEEETAEAEDGEDTEVDGDGSIRRRRRSRRRRGSGEETSDDPNVVVKIREPRAAADEVQGVSGSTRLEAKRQRRRDGREQRRTRPPILTEAEFLARREAVDRVMVVRQLGDRTQTAVLEDGVLVEHYVARASQSTMVGNVYLGRVQNVLPSMEAAFVDIGRGRNAVLYAGEVNWDAVGLSGRGRSIEQALKPGDSVLVQVTKDPVGHKGARLTSHIALSGRHLVYVPHGNASGISRKLSDTERKRLRDILKQLVPDEAGVIVRTAAEGASTEELERDVTRLQAQWEAIEAKSKSGSAPVALYEEPDLVIRVVRDLFNEDFRELIIQGDDAWDQVEPYLEHVSPDLVGRLSRYSGVVDVFQAMRIDEQIMKALDRKVFLPSGGSLVIDRTEAMTVIDVNTGKFIGHGGNLEETVTKNNLEAAEEIVRQLRLRDIGGIIVVDFIDMVLESNRELVLRRLTECLGRDRTKHQVTEITSLGLVQMTRKRMGQGLLEAFSETCDCCKGRGLIIHPEPVLEPGAAKPKQQAQQSEDKPAEGKSKRKRRRGGARDEESEDTPQAEPADDDREPVLAGAVTVAAAAPSQPSITVRASDDDPDAASEDEHSEEPGRRRRRSSRRRGK